VTLFASGTRPEGEKQKVAASCGPSAFRVPRAAAADVVFTGGSPLRVPPAQHCPVGRETDFALQPVEEVVVL